MEAQKDIKDLSEELGKDLIQWGDKISEKLEAAPGFEPGNRGFADRCLTTWLCRH